MKFFCLVFAFYTLGISIMPCNDVHDGAINPATTFSQAEDHHKSHNDVCSPFCICSCCQGAVTLTSSLAVTVFPVMDCSDFTSCSGQFISSSTASIWQPPKVG